jgi:hypothetical protein
MSDASVLLKTRKEETKLDIKTDRFISMDDSHTQANRKRILNEAVKPPTTEFCVPRGLRKSLQSQHEKGLRRFKHAKALAIALNTKNIDGEEVYALLLELKRRI